MTMKTKVIFKRLGGETVAVFPEIPGTYDPYSCLCYASMGQHSSTFAYLAGAWRRATEDQYADLHAELTQRGYEIRIAHKFTQANLATRKRELARH